MGYWATPSGPMGGLSVVFGWMYVLGFSSCLVHVYKRVYCGCCQVKCHHMRDKNRATGRGGGGDEPSDSLPYVGFMPLTSKRFYQRKCHLLDTLLQRFHLHSCICG